MNIFRNISRHFRAWRIAKLLPDAHQLYYASIMAYARRASLPPYADHHLPSFASSSSSSSSPFAVLQRHPHTQRVQEYLLPLVCQIINYGRLLSLPHLSKDGSTTTTPNNFSLSSTVSTAPITVRTSTIPNAGFGLFSTRDIYRGEIIAIYPGILHGRNENSGKFYGESMGIFDRNDDVSLEEEEIKHKTNVTSSNYVLRRVDGISVDAGDYVTAEAIEQLTNRYSPYTLAHFANHPPKDSSPTVIEISINIPLQSRYQEKDSPTYVSPALMDQWLEEHYPFSFVPLQRRSKIPYNWAPLPLYTPMKSLVNNAEGSEKIFEPRDNDIEESKETVKIQNRTYTIPTQGTIPVTLFIAIDNIPENKEIFFDYSYLPGTKSQPLPLWYNLIPPSKQWQLLYDACQEAKIDLPDCYPKIPLSEIDNVWYERLHMKED